MKPQLLHGPAINISRLHLGKIKEKFPTNNIVVYEEGSNIETILGSLITIPLIDEERLMILENPPEDFSNYTLYPIPYTLVLWFDHQVNEKKPILEWAKKNGQVLFFPESKEVSVFPFLDYLANKDKKAYFELNKLKKAGFEAQYFITMIFYLLRNLVSSPKNAPQFVKDKLVRQRKNFSTEDLIKLYKEILEIDFKIKSGLLDTAQAEFLLINKFIGIPSL